MAERGAQPHVPWGRRVFLRAVRRLFSPLKPDDYLEMINPLWTTKELRGKVERIEPQGSEAASVLIRPGYEWPGHKPGQYVRLGVVIDGVYYWRAYSLTSDPAPDDGLISVTPKRVDGGVVSPYLVHKIQPGDLVRLGEIEGVFTLPEPAAAEVAVHQRRQRYHADHQHAAQLGSSRRIGRRSRHPLGPHPRTGHVLGGP